MSGLTESEKAAIVFGLPPVVMPRVLSVCENILATRLAAAEQYAERVTMAALPIIEYLSAVEAFYGTDPYDGDGDVIDTASGDPHDTALRWSHLRALRLSVETLPRRAYLGSDQ